MTVLAFDTCFAGLSVAVATVRGGDVVQLADVFERIETGHAERLVPAIARTLDRAGSRYNDITRIAVTVGPGSFTGIRVGIAAARALSLALAVPVVGMTSLEVARHEVRERLGDVASQGRLAVVMDARRGALYAQVFEADGATAGPRLVTLDEARADPSFDGVLAVGSGARLLAEARSGAINATLPDLLPNAKHLAREASGLMPLASVAPVYLRAADARPPAHLDLRG
jgi:tRNA threonylcarbamoyladenosine biosynthesis protein TsaB